MTDWAKQHQDMTGWTTILRMQKQRDAKKKMHQKQRDTSTCASTWAPYPDMVEQTHTKLIFQFSQSWASSRCHATLVWEIVIGPVIRNEPCPLQSRWLHRKCFATRHSGKERAQYPWWPIVNWDLLSSGYGNSNLISNVFMDWYKYTERAHWAGTDSNLAKHQQALKRFNTATASWCVLHCHGRQCSTCTNLRSAPLLQWLLGKDFQC